MDIQQRAHMDTWPQAHGYKWDTINILCETFSMLWPIVGGQILYHDPKHLSRLYADVHCRKADSAPWPVAWNDLNSQLSWQIQSDLQNDFML
jgi:hypothetical protein